MLKQIEEEIEHKQQFAEECLEAGDLQNANYWKAFVHGLRFARDIITQQGQSSERDTTEPESGDHYKCCGGIVTHKIWCRHSRR